MPDMQVHEQQHPNDTLGVEDIRFIRAFRQTFNAMLASSNGAGFNIDTNPAEGMASQVPRAHVIIPDLTQPIRPKPVLSVRQKKIFDKFGSESLAMEQELETLHDHLIQVGGYKAVVADAQRTRDTLFDFFNKVNGIMVARPLELNTKDIKSSLKELEETVCLLHHSLYLQKHAFYFRHVKQWLIHLQLGTENLGKMYDSERIRGAVLDDFLPKMVDIMGSVIPEFRDFTKTVLPTFLAGEEERATTRYVNMTTIATFFSSVTATTLQTQFALQSTNTTLGNIVYLCWFLSLVFSVSSGINSLLGMTWRKSTIFNTIHPPGYVRAWMEKAPMLFLVVSAVAFVIGLNVFVYQSHQASFVSTTTTIFTSLHIFTVLIACMWFIHKLSNSISLLFKVLFTPIRILVRVGQYIAFTYYRRRKYILRNLYWALRLDDKVPSLNWEIAEDLNWVVDRSAKPHLLSKFSRTMLGFCSKGVLSSRMMILHFVRSSVNGQYEARHNAEGIRDSSSLYALTGNKAVANCNEAKRQFYNGLAEVFTNGFVMSKVKDVLKKSYKNTISIDEIETKMIALLWGYSDLEQEVHTSLMPAVVKEREWFNDRRRNEQEDLLTRVYANPSPSPSPARTFPSPWDGIQRPNIHSDYRAQEESGDAEGEQSLSFSAPQAFHLLRREGNASSEGQTSGTNDPSSSSQPIGMVFPFDGPMAENSYHRPARTLADIDEGTGNQPADDEHHQNLDTEQADLGFVPPEDNSDSVSDSRRDRGSRS